jgi:hypothetical protein
VTIRASISQSMTSPQKIKTPAPCPAMRGALMRALGRDQSPPVLLEVIPSAANSSAFIGFVGWCSSPEVALAITAGPASHRFIAGPFPQQKHSYQS